MEEKNQCDICMKEFTKKYNLNQHIRQVHQLDKPHECEVCGKRFTRKQHRDLHRRNCPITSGGKVTKEFQQAVEDPQFTPVLRSSSFNKHFTWWEIKFPKQSYYIDTKLLLKKSIHSMKTPIQEQLRTKDPRMKFVMSVEVTFQQGSDPSIKTNPPVWFHGSPYLAWKHLPRVDPTHMMLEESLESATNELFEAIEEYEGCGSGWVVDHLVSLEGNCNSF